MTPASLCIPRCTSFRTPSLFEASNLEKLKVSNFNLQTFKPSIERPRSGHHSEICGTDALAAGNSANRCKWCPGRYATHSKKSENSRYFHRSYEKMPPGMKRISVLLPNPNTRPRRGVQYQIGFFCITMALSRLTHCIVSAKSRSL